MNQLEALRRSVELADAVLGDLRLDTATLARPTPCAAFDVSGLLDHVAQTHRFLTAAAGGEIADDGSDPVAVQRAAGAAAVAAWTRRGTEGSVDLGGNQLPASFALGLHALEAFVHAWDLAAATGVAFEPSNELIDVAWEQARMIVSDDARGTSDDAPYGPAVTVAETASSLDHLLAFTGRDPGDSRWARI